MILEDHNVAAMHMTPSFQLTCPPRPAWDAEQTTLFALDGRPTPSSSDAEILQGLLAGFLESARVPASHRASFTHALCDGAPIDPGFIVRLGSPGRRQRWRDLVKAIDPSDKTGGTASVRARANALIAQAEATRTWPRRAITVLRRQRTKSGAFDLSTFPQLPPHLRPWRHALHAMAMQTRALLYEAFGKPAVVTSSGTVRTVVVLGCICLVFDQARRDIRVGQLGPSGWNRLPNATANLLQPLPDDAWCRQFSRRLSQPIRVMLGASWSDEKVREGCFNWLADVVQQLATRSKLMEHVRDLLRRAYPCDPQLIRDALTCTIDYRRHQGLTTREYVAAWRNAEILRSRVAEAPQLASVWALAVRAGYLKVDDGYGVLRNLFQDWGVTASGWQLLIRRVRQLYRPLIRSTDDPRYGCAELVRYVRLLQRGQWREPMPFVLANALFAPYWFSRELDPSQLPLRLVRAALERIKGPMPLGALDSFIEQELIPVLGWISRAKPAFDNNQQRAPWRWFFTHYEQWCETERLKRDGRRWTTGLDGLRWRRFEITPIRDSATLWLDGEKTRMCLSLYEHDCAEGRYIVYAVRAPGRARPVAHIGLRLNADGAAKLDQVRGFANSPVEPALAKFARRLSDLHAGTRGELVAPEQDG